jgi:hypothetical protein
VATSDRRRAAVQNGQRPPLPENLCDVLGSRPHELLPALREYIVAMQACWAQARSGNLVLWQFSS